MPNGGIVGLWSAASILVGLTRDTLIKLAAEQDLEVVEQDIPREMLYMADELFLTGTAAEITPMRSLDDREIGEGKPGPVTKRVQEEYFAVIKGQRSEYAHWLTYL